MVDPVEWGPAKPDGVVNRQITTPPLRGTPPPEGNYTAAALAPYRFSP